MQSLFDLMALLLTAAAALGYVNHRLLRLPLTVGLLVCGCACAMAVAGADAVLPGLAVEAGRRGLLARVNFPATLLQGFLGFLLFAGTLEVDFDELFERKWTVLALATFGTVLSTALVGGAL